MNENLRRNHWLRLPTLLATCMCAALGARLAPAQDIQADVVSVGFPASTGGARYAFRYGQWVPILVQISTQATTPETIRLRCELTDRDGDHVAYLTDNIVANPGTVRRVWAYAVLSRQDTSRTLRLDVLGEDGHLITSTPLPPIEPIHNDARILLDISDKRFTPIDGLADSDSVINEATHAGRTHYRPIVTARMPARNLPDRWIGLEAASVVFWDEPDPDQLDAEQVRALVDWVRNGGRLVLGLGPAWSRVQKSALAEILPLTGSQPPIPVRQLPVLQRRFGLGQHRPFDTPVLVGVGQPTPDAIVTLRDRLPDNRPVNLVAMRWVGSGRVIAVATGLRDLHGLRWLGRRDPFVAQVIDLNPLEPEFVTKEAEQVWILGVHHLFTRIVSAIDFRRLASVRTFAAIAFVAAYVLLATLGVWAWLHRHKLAHLNWVVFSAFAIAASAVSLATIRLAHGFREQLHTMAFVDLHAGSSEAIARTYYGFKSPRRERVDLSVTGRQAFLRPLATGFAVLSARYATPSRYDALPTQATLRRSLVRATLKQFESFWRGSLHDRVGAPITIRGNLTASRATGELSPDSWIENGLDAPITGGYLLYIDPRLRELDGVPVRVAGLTRRNDRPDMENKYWDQETVPPAVNVLAVPLPPIKPGARATRLYHRLYRNYEIRRQAWRQSPKPDPHAEPMLPTLYSVQVDEWIDSVSVLGGKLTPIDAAAMLASTRNLFVNNRKNKDFRSLGPPISTDALPDLDVTHWLARGQAVLLLVVEAPGPAPLAIDGKPDRARITYGRALYRVRIPIAYTGNPPARKKE